MRDCRSYVHDISALRLLLSDPIPGQCSVVVRIDNKLHAKLYIFDDLEAIVTSSNLTFAGFNRNLEVALAVSLPTVVQTAIGHFQSLFRNAVPLTETALDAVSASVRGLSPAGIDLLDTDDVSSEPDDGSEPAEDLGFVFNHKSIERIETSLNSDVPVRKAGRWQSWHGMLKTGISNGTKAEQIETEKTSWPSAFVPPCLTPPNGRTEELHLTLHVLPFWSEDCHARVVVSGGGAFGKVMELQGPAALRCGVVGRAVRQQGVEHEQGARLHRYGYAVARVDLGVADLPVAL